MEKVFLSTQLLSVLPPVVLKVASFICNWQNSPNGIMLFEHRFAKTLKLSDEEVKLSIQTLLDLHLISLTKVEDKFKIEFNHSEWQKYYKIGMDKVIEHQGYKMATEVTYDKELETPKKEKDISDMSDAELKTLLLRIQASLNERELLKKKVVNLQSSNDGLPW